MKQYLIDLFKYNDWANRELLETIRQMPEPEEAVRLFSHLITAQNKWLNRITPEMDDQALTWFGPAFPIDELESTWRESLDKWLTFIESRNESDIEDHITFRRANDGKKLAVRIRDIALQLNYHAIHHRAQINSLISAQGLPVPATDYIFTVLEEAGINDE